MTVEKMARYRTTVDLAGERPVGQEGSEYRAGAGGHAAHRPPTELERAAARERMLWQIVDGEMRERAHAEGLVDRLRCELALYRPDPLAAEPAPKVPGFWLVSVSGHTGLCYARIVLEKYPGGGLPDFEMPNRTTLCGQKTGGPGSIPGYGWPPASMVCAKCRAALPDQPSAQLTLLDEAAS